MANEVQADEIIIEWSGSTVGGSNSFSFNLGSDNVDVTTFDNADWTFSKAGMKNWGGSIDGIYQFGSDNTYTKFIDHLITGNTPVTLAFKASKTGEKYYTGDAILESIDFSGSLKDPVEWSVSFTGVGAITSETAV